MAKASKKSSAASKKTSKAAPKKAAAPAKKTASKSASKSSSKSASKTSSKAASKAPKKSARKPNAAFMAPQTPSSKLAEVIGNKPMPRTEIVKKIWDYIKKNDLQDKKNRRMINADGKLKPLFGKDQFSMFEVASVVNKNIEK
ncbi:MAG: SWIB/MDM2 domain-containing protein [Candidatus Dadabacteria bacterium]